MADKISAMRRLETLWGPLALAALMTGWCVWYLIDAYQASSRTQNLIFIAPAATIAVVLFLVVLFVAVMRSPARAAESDPQVAEATAQGLAMPIAVMILLGLYVVSLRTLGFDVATFLFIAGTLLAQGERRPLFILVYSAVFAAVVVWIFKAMLTLDMPTVVI